MADKKNVAILGATGAVGSQMLECLAERDFPVGELRLLASARSAGKVVEWCGREVVIEEARPEAFEGMDIVLGAADDDIAKALLPEAVRRGATVVDNSHAFRLDEDVPLVVPEINPEDAKRRPRNIIANPNCTTIMMVVALYPIERLSHIRKIHIASYQSASGAGAEAMRELQQQYKEILETGSAHSISHFPHQLAYNVIPQIDKMTDNDYTKEEMKMYHETRKIMHSDVRTSATCVRVSSLRSHSESVWFETERPLSVEEIRQALQEAPGVTLVDDPQHYVYPMPLESAGKDDVFVGRIRKDLADDHSCTLWLTGDQIRKGAALNAVQIAEIL